MMNYYSRFFALAAGVVLGGSAMAVEPPTAPTQTLQDGETYLLMNYARPTKYSTRTSWDGAYYLLDYEAWLNNTGAWKPIDFQAHQNEDGTWSFSYEETKDGETSTIYLGLPSGSGNLKSVGDNKVDWTVAAGDYEGYYRLLPGEGNPNSLVIGHPLHLNGGGEYAIIYFEGNGFGYDIYDDIQYDEFNTPVWEDVEADMLYPVFNSYDHANWAFIHEADILPYHQKYTLYSTIVALEDGDYADEYAEGYTSLLEAITAVYESEDGDMAAAAELVEVKKALQAAIDTAIGENEEDDATLNAAIDKATATFNQSNDAATLANAIVAIESALKVYKAGTGDFTSFGQNMSFEDLSNQGGNQSSGVTNAPAGWNLYLNGKLCNTADEIKAAGVGAWCSINNDSDGDKDGEYSFGIWNSSIPEVELSQTISGLENGTYLITAGVMVGANGSGSRMTTQRLFGNLNSALFGSESDYNSEYLNPAEVYEYAGLGELTTDRTLQDMAVSAYVYDGTLTFGLRTNGKWQAVNGRTGGNGAGGDGWFKVDNFRINYMGYDPETAADIVDYYQTVLNDLLDYDMQGSVAQKAEEMSEFNPNGLAQEAVNAFILEIKDYIGVVKSSVDAYAAMYEYIEKCYENAEEYYDYAGIDAYNAAVTKAMAQVESCELDEEGLAALKASLEEAFNTLKLSGVKVGEDVTNMIANASFEDNSDDKIPNGWNLYVDGKQCFTGADVSAAGLTNWCGINGGDNISGDGFTDEDGNLIEFQPTEGSYLFGIWNPSIPEIELSQTITGLPAGTYTLTADVMVQYTWAGDNLTTQRIFANEALCMFGCPDDYLKNATPDMLAAIERDRAAGFHIEADDFVIEDEEEEGDEDEEFATRADGDDYLDDSEIDAYRQMNYARYVYGNSPDFDLLHKLTLKFVVAEDGEAYIGFRTNGIDRQGNTGNSNGWFKVDNFTLYYENAEIPTAIGCVQSVADSQKAEFYTVGGLRLSTLQRGLNIVRQGGKAYNVVVK